MTLCDRVPKLNKCCFCINLRLGGIALGVIYLLGSMALIGSYSFLVSQIEKGNNTSDYNLTLSGAIVMLVAACIQLLLAIMLLLGIMTNRQHLMLPYLWLQIINIGLYFGIGIFQIIFLMWGTAIGTFIGGFIGLYFWMCIQSLYQELKEGSRPGPTAAY